MSLCASSFLQVPEVRHQGKLDNDRILSTNLRIIPVEAKVLRSSARNNVVYMMVLLSGDDHHRRQQHMVFVVEAVQRMAMPCSHRFSKLHQKRSLVCTTLLPVLRTAHLREFDDHPSECRDPRAVVDSVLDREYSFAEFGGLLVLGMVTRRGRRMFYLTSGWLHKHWRCLASEGEAQFVAVEFNKDYAIFLLVFQTFP